MNSIPGDQYQAPWSSLQKQRDQPQYLVDSLHLVTAQPTQWHSAIKYLTKYIQIYWIHTFKIHQSACRFKCRQLTIICLEYATICSSTRMQASEICSKLATIAGHATANPLALAIKQITEKNMITQHLLYIPISRISWWASKRNAYELTVITLVSGHMTQYRLFRRRLQMNSDQLSVSQVFPLCTPHITFHTVSTTARTTIPRLCSLRFISPSNHHCAVSKSRSSMKHT